MQTHLCRFCKTQFSTEDLKKHVCDDCFSEVKTVIVEDEKLRFQLIEAILKDQIVIERLAKQVFSVPVKNIGIGGSGSIADFFRPEGEADSRK